MLGFPFFVLRAFSDLIARLRFVRKVDDAVMLEFHDAKLETFSSCCC